MASGTHQPRARFIVIHGFNAVAELKRVDVVRQRLQRRGHPRLQRRGRIEASGRSSDPTARRSVIHGFNAVAELKQLDAAELVERYEHQTVFRVVTVNFLLQRSTLPRGCALGRDSNDRRHR